MRSLFILLLFVSGTRLWSQDRLFLTDGRMLSGKLLTLEKDTILFSGSDSVTQAIPRNSVLMIETATGRRLLFAQRDSLKNNNEKFAVPRNQLGICPLGLFVGRATVVYERLSKDGRIGYAFPFSLTFDPTTSLYGENTDSGRVYTSPLGRLGWIGGVDINFYTRRPLNGFFIGPRFRYGTDVFLGRVEGFTLQTQIGFYRSKPGRSYVRHFSLGFGFVRLMEAPGIRLRQRQYFPWMSVNYRIGLRW